MAEKEKKGRCRLAIFASGTGSNAEALIHESFRQDSAYAVQLVIGNNSGARVMQLAPLYDIPVVHLSSRTHPDAADYARAMLAVLEEHRVDIIALAGYMKRVPPPVIEAYPGRILNVHPALLPKFGGQGMHGRRVHEAVLAAGEQKTGVTIHAVDEEYDSGAIIAQEEVAVQPDDTAESLAARVLDVEHRLYAAVVQQLAQELRGTALSETV